MNIHTIDPLAVAIRNVIGPLWACHERSPYLRHFRDLKLRQFDPPAAVQARQWEAIRQLVSHAYDRVPFFRRKFDESGLGPDRIRHPDDFAAIPVLTKSEIREHGSEMLAEGYDRSSLVREDDIGLDRSIARDPGRRACHAIQAGRTLRSDEWSGWRFGEPIAAIWGNPGYLKHGWRGRLRNALLERRRYLDTLKMDEATMARSRRY